MIGIPGPGAYFQTGDALKSLAWSERGTKWCLWRVSVIARLTATRTTQQQFFSRRRRSTETCSSCRGSRRYIASLGLASSDERRTAHLISPAEPPTAGCLKLWIALWLYEFREKKGRLAFKIIFYTGITGACTFSITIDDWSFIISALFLD